MRRHFLYSLVLLLLFLGSPFTLDNVHSGEAAKKPVDSNKAPVSRKSVGSSQAATKAVPKDPMAEKRAKMLLVRKGILDKPDLMLNRWLLQQIDAQQAQWQSKYSKLKTVEEVKKYQQEHIDFFRKQLGSTWSKTPLNAKVTGRLEKKQYRVEKIVFESVPKFYVTGTMFLPLESQFKPPYPAVLVVCGHTATGKAAPWMQSLCVLGAANGLAMFIMDPIDQGERWQLIQPDGKCPVVSVAAHNVVGSGSILLGRNTATFEVWDMTRALDYLQSRKDIIPDKLGAAGISGGGTQSSYLMALDPRVLAAAPCCYLCNIFDNLMYVNGPQDAEQNIFGQTAFGMDHSDYIIMRAPKPTLVCAATDDFFNIEDGWSSFRYASRIYTRFGLPERAAIMEVDSPHHYCKEHFEATVRWMLRWLAGQNKEIWWNDDLTVLTEQEIRSLPEFGVYGPNGPKDAKTTYDLNRDLAKELTSKRAELWKQNLSGSNSNNLQNIIRSVAGIRSKSELPKIQIHEKTPEKDEFVLISDPGIYLPVKSNIIEQPKNITLFISDKGRNSAKADALFAKKDRATFAVELRGWGESQAFGRNYYRYDWFGSDGSDYYMAYLLGKSYIGLRTDDLLAVALFLKKQYGQGIKIDLLAEGSASIVALHAGAVHPELFWSISYDKKELPNWNEMIEKSPTPIQLSDTIHGVLNFYDTDNLSTWVESQVKNNRSMKRK